MSEEIAASVIHADSKRLAIAMCSHDRSGNAIPYTGGSYQSGAACPGNPCFVEQMTFLSLSGTGTKTVSLSDLTSLIIFTQGATGLSIPNIADIIYFYGLKSGDLFKIRYLKTQAATQIQVFSDATIYGPKSMFLMQVLIPGPL